MFSLIKWKLQFLASYELSYTKKNWNTIHWSSLYISTYFFTPATSIFFKLPSSWLFLATFHLLNLKPATSFFVCGFYEVKSRSTRRVLGVGQPHFQNFGMFVSSCFLARILSADNFWTGSVDKKSPRDDLEKVKSYPESPKKWSIKPGWSWNVDKMCVSAYERWTDGVLARFVCLESSNWTSS